MDPVSLGVAVGLSLLMLAVIYLDATRYIIPNWLNGAILLLYPAFLLLNGGGISIGSGLIMAGVLFAFGFLVFWLGLMGGGDVKLLTVLGLWTGFGYAGLGFVIYTTLYGGLLAAVVLAIRGVIRVMSTPEYHDTLPRILRRKEPVPYGLAIAFGFLTVLWLGVVPGVTLYPPPAATPPVSIDAQ